MHTIASSEVVNHIHPEAITVSLRQMNGDPCREIGIEELKALAANEHVIGLGRRGKLLQIRLTVAPDQAFRELGETRIRVQDALHSEANITTIKESIPNSPKITQHHKAHCGAWDETRLEEASILEEYRSGVSVEEIEGKHRLPWTGSNSLYAILDRHGIQRRNQVRSRQNKIVVQPGGTQVAESVAAGIPRLRVFKPYTDDERIELYRRVWGPNWDPALIGIHRTPLAA